MHIFESKNELDIPEVFAGLLTIIMIGLLVENVISVQSKIARCAAGACRREGRGHMSTLESRSVRRREDQRLLTGGGNYADDAHREGMLHAILVRSPHAHARITGIDVSAARGLPGVVAPFIPRTI